MLESHTVMTAMSVHTGDAGAELKELWAGNQKSWEPVLPLRWIPFANSSNSSICSRELTRHEAHGEKQSTFIPQA